MMYFTFDDDGDEYELTRRGLLKAGGGAAVGVGALGLIGGLAESAEAAPKPKRGGTLLMTTTFASANDSLDYQASGNPNVAMFAMQVYDKLVTHGVDFKSRPVLAKRWRSNSKATVWTFYLRRGVRFSDGTPLTAKDVKYSIGRVLDRSVRSGAYNRLAASLDVDGIQVLDAHTIRFKLKRADAEFDLALGQRQCAIAKSGTISRGRRAIGTGPFMVKSFTPGGTWELVRNPHYWQKGLPYLDGVRFVATADPGRLLQSVASGSAHLSGFLPYGQLAGLKRSSSAKLLTAPSSAFMYTVMETRAKPFDDPRVVRAFKLAVNRQAVINASARGSRPTSDVMCAASSKYYPAKLGVRKQDIEAARRLLAQAGHRNGVELELFTAPFAAGVVEYATAMRQIVAPAGFRLKVTQTDVTTWATKVWQKEPLYCSYTAVRPPLSAMSAYSISGAAYPEGHFTSKKLDNLVVRALATTNVAERTRLTKECFMLLADRGPLSIPMSVTIPWAAKKNLYGAEVVIEDFVHLHKAYLA